MTQTPYEKLPLVGGAAEAEDLSKKSSETTATVPADYDSVETSAYHYCADWPSFEYDEDHYHPYANAQADYGADVWRTSVDVYGPVFGEFW